MPINRRRKGGTYERHVAKLYREVGYTSCVTARAESRTTDAKGVDICFTGPFGVQTKCHGKFSAQNILQALNDIKTNSEFRVCHVKISKIGGKHSKKGAFVAIPESERMELLSYMLQMDEKLRAAGMGIERRKTRRHDKLEA